MSSQWLMAVTQKWITLLAYFTSGWCWWKTPRRSLLLSIKTWQRLGSCDPALVKWQIFENPRSIPSEEDVDATNAQALYAQYFNRWVNQILVFLVGDMVNVGKSPNLKRESTNTLTQDPSKRPLQEINRPFKVLQLTKQTSRVDIN